MAHCDNHPDRLAIRTKSGGVRHCGECHFAVPGRPADDGDDYPNGWFGESWGAPICEQTRHMPTPAGRPCIRCDRPITPDAQGMIIPHVEGRGMWYLVAYGLRCWGQEAGHHHRHDPVAARRGGGGVTTLEAAIARQEWRYMMRGRVSHALGSSLDVVALCGRGPWSADQWRGTGSQEEYETVAAMPRCVDCVKVLALTIQATSRILGEEGERPC